MAIMVTEETDEVTSIYPEIRRIVRMECLLKYLDGEERAFVYCCRQEWNQNPRKCSSNKSRSDFRAWVMGPPAVRTVIPTLLTKRVGDRAVRWES